jgi:hypothetical protein
MALRHSAKVSSEYYRRLGHSHLRLDKPCSQTGSRFGPDDILGHHRPCRQRRSRRFLLSRRVSGLVSLSLRESQAPRRLSPRLRVDEKKCNSPRRPSSPVVLGLKNSILTCHQWKPRPPSETRRSLLVTKPSEPYLRGRFQYASYFLACRVTAFTPRPYAMRLVQHFLLTLRLFDMNGGRESLGIQNYG